MKRLLISIICIFLALTAGAQAPKDTKNIIITTTYGTTEEAISDIVQEILPAFNVPIEMLNKEYGLINTAITPCNDPTVAVRIYFQIREEEGIILNMYAHVFTQTLQGLPSPASNTGMRGSILQISWKFIENIAAAIPSRDIQFR